MSIKLISRIDFSNAAERWKRQYCEEGKWGSTVSGSAKKTYDAIIAAGTDLNAIDAAIGNKSWTHYSCSSCGEYFDFGVQMLEPDYETTPYFCSECIMKAAQLVQYHEQGKVPQ